MEEMSEEFLCISRVIVDGCRHSCCDICFLVDHEESRRNISFLSSFEIWLYFLVITRNKEIKYARKHLALRTIKILLETLTLVGFLWCHD